MRAGPAAAAMTTSVPATGVWFFPDQPAPALVDAIVDAEAVGLDEVWVGDEGPAREPFTVLAAAAMRTSRIRLAIGVTNPYVRHPGIAGATAATIAELSAGRATLGVGAGGAMSLQPFDLVADAPLGAVRRFIEIVRAGREGLTIEGHRASDLAVAPVAPPVPVFVGARGPRLNELASEIADGAFVAGMPPFRYAEVIGRARSIRPIDIALYPSVAFDEAGRERHRPEMIWSLLDTPADVRDRLGLDPVAIDAAAAAVRGGDPEPARRLVTDDLLEELMIVGEPHVVGAALAELVRQYRPSSVGLAMIQPDLGRGIDDAALAFAEMRRLLATDAHPSGADDGRREQQGRGSSWSA